MHTEFALKSDQIVTPQGVRAGYIVVLDGKIVSVMSQPPEASTPVTDLTQYVIMPGVIDPHVHINEPGRTDWEGFETATRAAISGGITCLVDMPLNASPVTTNVAALETKLYAATGQLNTNCGFWGGIVPGNEQDIEALAENGVLGFKAFLTHSGIDEFPNVTENDLLKVMPVLARLNLPLLVHAELSDPNHMAVGDPRSYNNYLQSRPGSWEDDAIAMMIRLCEKFDCRVHIVHLSAASSIEQIAAAKRRGLPITVETAQHYLYFQAEEIPDSDTSYKCAPPIRGQSNNDQLWQALLDGTIDFVATDHSPAPPALKQTATGNFMSAWGGIASVQFALPALYSAGLRHGSCIADIVRWLCEKPAVLIGKQATKGRIEAGYDADIAVFDEARKWTVTESLIHHKHKNTPYLGHELQGLVVQTYLGGEKVFDRGAFTPHRGKIITRSL